MSPAPSGRNDSWCLNEVETTGLATSPRTHRGQACDRSRRPVLLGNRAGARDFTSSQALAWACTASTLDRTQVHAGTLDGSCHRCIPSAELIRDADRGGCAWRGLSHIDNRTSGQRHHRRQIDR